MVSASRRKMRAQRRKRLAMARKRKRSETNSVDVSASTPDSSNEGSLAGAALADNLLSACSPTGRRLEGVARDVEPARGSRSVAEVVVCGSGLQDHDGYYLRDGEMYFCHRRSRSRSMFWSLFLDSKLFSGYGTGVIVLETYRLAPAVNESHIRASPPKCVINTTYQPSISQR